MNKPGENSNAAPKDVPAQPIPSCHIDLEAQAYYIGRIERRLQFLRKKIPTVTDAEKRKFEILEAQALQWACDELSKLLESNRKFYRHFASRFAEKEPEKAKAPHLG